MTTNYLAPAAYATYVCRSGSSYNSNGFSLIVNPLASDILDLMNMGCTLQQQAAAIVVPPMQIPMLSGRNASGTGLIGIGLGGDFSVVLSLGTTQTLKGNAAQLSTSTNIVVFERVLSEFFLPATDIKATLNANYTGSGVVGAHTVSLAAYKPANDGTESANLIATATQSLGVAPTDFQFLITGASFSPGDRIVMKATTVIQETGALNSLTAQLNSLRLSQ